jgi:hypothetical protein
MGASKSISECGFRNADWVPAFAEAMAWQAEQPPAGGAMVLAPGEFVLQRIGPYAPAAECNYRSRSHSCIVASSAKTALATARRERLTMDRYCLMTRGPRGWVSSRHPHNQPGGGCKGTAQVSICWRSRIAGNCGREPVSCQSGSGNHERRALFHRDTRAHPESYRLPGGWRFNRRVSRRLSKRFARIAKGVRK